MHAPRPSRIWRVIAMVCLVVSARATAENSLAALPDDLTELPLETLLMIEVTSVTRSKQSLSQAPAAIQVISGEQLRRLGARNLPDALRLAVGIQVARINGRSWAIAGRGFNSALSDKLEVRLDGRSLYTPLFSGVLWEFHDVPLELVEQIEIVRGPGATLWGANAINGVINIITRPPEADDGTRLRTQVGEDQRYRASLEQSIKLGRQASLRLFGRQAEWRELDHGSDTPSLDARRIKSLDLQARSGVNRDNQWRVDFNATDASMQSPQAAAGARETMQGAALNTEYTFNTGDHSGWELGLHADYFDRDIPQFFGEIRRQYDMEIRHHREIGADHNILLGLSYRRSEDDIRNSQAVIFEPASKALDTLTLFLQDRITLSPQLELTLGGRLERNDYTGWETQPNLRLAWTPSDSSLIWAAYASASRAPNRVDRDYIIPGQEPGTFFIVNNNSFDTEKVRFSEIGLRRQLSSTLLLDLSTFYAHYDDMRGVSVNDEGQSIVSNEGRGYSHGLELLLNWLPVKHVAVDIGYSFLDLRLEARPGSVDTSIAGSNENDPRHQAWLSAQWTPHRDLSGAITLRHVGPLDDPGTPEYTELDLHFDWQLNSRISIQLGGRNLLDSAHPEFNDGSAQLVRRSGYAGLGWSF